MLKRLTGVALIATVTVISLAGCSLIGGFVRNATGTTSTGTNEQVDANLTEFYHQSLRWTSCESTFQCTTVKAPISWVEPELGSIDLAVIRSQATGTRLGSLLVNPGGPGGSGYDQVTYDTYPGLDASYDIVGWDPRGVGRSTPVTCYTSDADRDESIYGTFDAEYQTQAWIDELTTAQQDYAAACLTNTGELLGNVDTVSTAKDLDLLRAVLGDTKVNYLGYSYGTKIGAIYAELFPEKVGRMVLDGVVDPLVSDFDGLKTQMAGFESAFRAYLTDCLAASGCPFTGTLDEALAQAEALIGSADDTNLVNADGRQLDSATVGTGVALNLYSESYWPDLSEMFAALHVGDPSLSFTSADYYNDRGPDGSYASNSVDVYQAVTCVDGDFLDDPASTLDRVAEIDAAAPTIGKYFTYDDFAVLDVLCTNWPVAASTPPTVYDAAGAAPILVIGTTNDPATPYEQAVSMSKQLESGVLITYTGEGHTIYNQGVACVDDAVNAYFVSGTVPAADPQC